MNVVLVQHGDELSKTYCFEVPDSLLPHLKQGTRVFCDTNCGSRLGFIASLVATGEAAERLIEAHGATRPLRKIFAALSEVKLSDLSIPASFLRSHPSKIKLLQRHAELIQFGGVMTCVRIDENGVLRNGYTAFVACRDAGMTSLPFYVWDSAATTT